MSNSAATNGSPERKKTPALAIIVLSDRRLFRDCIVAFLRRHGFPQTTGRTRWPVLNRAATAALGLVLIDLGQEEDDPRAILRELRERAPAASVVAIGTPMQLAAQAADADGWLKPSDAIERLSAVAAAVTRPHTRRITFPTSSEIRRHLRTWSSLTARQRQVLALLGCGIDNHRLAEALGTSQRAVKAHVSALLDKFKAEGRAELAVIACRAGLHRPKELDAYRS